MKKVVRILLAILMVAALALGITACKSECQKGNHVFTGEENVVTPATCETNGIKTVKCVNCDQTKEVTIPKLGHDYTGANWSPCEDDETQHQRTCVRSGCGHVEKAPHSFVEGVCVCGKTEGTSSCNHANKYLASTTSATCISAKVEHWACHDCDWTEDKTVGEPLGHDYAGAEWHADGNTHYQVCKRDGCDEHNSHVADMSTTWKPCADDETQHQKTCSHEGCGIVEKAAHGSVTVPGTPATCTEDGRRNGTKCPDCNKVLQEGAVIPKKGHNFATDWTHDQENGKHYHACLNEGCTARDSENKCDYQYGAAQTNATQHWGVCSVCGNQSKSENHNSDKVLPAVEAKCYQDGLKEGKACSVCNRVMVAQETISKDTVKHSWVWVYGDDRDDSHTDVDHYQKCSVAECGAITNAGAHALHMTQGDDNQHWQACQCGYVDESSKKNHIWAGEDGFACPTCGKVAPGVYLAVAIDGETTVHRLGETGTLQQAVDLVGEGKTATIYLGHDLSGSGVIVPSGRTITFRFNNHTYRVTDNLVGSSGTETNGFQLLKGSKITFINANIVAENASMYILVQNYANLTLDHVNLDAGNSSVTYVLSNNNGNILIKNDTKITAPANKYAFDVYYNLNGNYPDGVSVTVESGCLITGAIGYGGEHLTEGWQNKTLISLPNLGKNYNIKLQQGLGLTCESVGITIANTPLSHKEGAGKVTVPATCHSKGETSYCCTVCGKVMRTEEIEMTAHSWNAGEVTTAATCTEKGERTYTCTNDGCDTTRTEEIAALGHDWQTKWSYENNGDTHRHWHACNRCSERKDADTCTGVVVTEAKAPTCEGTGNNAGYQCSVCKNTWGGETIPAAGHHYSETLTAINATQHGYKCADCDKYDGVANHTYTANHCDACGNDITQAEIIELMKGLTKDGDVLVSADSTFVLTGIYGGIIKNLNYALNNEQGKQIIACFDRTLDPSQDLIVGDKISVTGKIKSYKGTVEFDGFTYELVKRGSSEVTAKVEVAEGTLPEGITVDFTPALDGGKAENMSTVKFVVNGLPEGWIVAGVTGIEYTFDPETNEYSFTVIGDTSFVVEVKLDDGKRTYEKTVEYVIANHMTDGANLLIDKGGINFDVLNIAVNPNSASSKSNFTSDQLRYYASNTLIIKIADSNSLSQITQIVFNIDSSSKYNGDGMTVDDVKLQKSGTDYIWSGKLSSVTFETIQQARINSITVTYTITVECKHEHAQTIAEAKGATCTEMGFKSAGIYCPDCGHFTTDGWQNLADEDIVAAKGHAYRLVEAVDGNCQTYAVAAHYICDNDGCNQWFVDENGAKKEVTPDEITAKEYGAHNYGAWSHVADTETHSRTCLIDGCGNVDTQNCTSATWHTSATEHWKVCDVCDTEFGRTAHSGDTCECGALKLSVAVVDEDNTAIADHDIQATYPAYAKVGDEIEITLTSQRFEIIMVVSGDNSLELAEGTNKYVGIVAEGGVITVYASELTSAQYKGVTVEGITASDVSVKLGDATEELAANTVLAEGNVINVVVTYDPDEVDVKVTVTQGSNSVDVALGEYNADELSATATYTCAALGDVTITVTARARVTVTIPSVDSAHAQVTVDKVTVDGNVTLASGDKVIVGDKIIVKVEAAQGYSVISTVVDGVNEVEGEVDTFVVTGNVSFTVTVVKQITVNIPTIDGATVTVKTESNQDVADGTAVPAGTKLIISVNVTDPTQQVASVKIGEETLTANGDGNFEYVISRDWSANQITVSVSLENKPAAVETLISVTGSQLLTYGGIKGTSYVDWNIDLSEKGLNASNELKTFKINGCKQTSTITDVPVTKTKAMTIEACEGKAITYFAVQFKQWTTKALGIISITITYADGTKTISGDDSFTLQTFDLSAYSNVTKIVVSSSQTSNQAGIAQIDIKVK